MVHWTEKQQRALSPDGAKPPELCGAKPPELFGAKPPGGAKPPELFKAKPPPELVLAMASVGQHVWQFGMKQQQVVW